MIRTKAYLLREITRLKKRKVKLTEELKMIKSYNDIGTELRSTIGLAAKEIDSIGVKIETLYWCANTSEKQLPKIKGKKKKKEHIEENKKK